MSWGAFGRVSDWDVLQAGDTRTHRLLTVAVGTALAGRPPHGSGRAELPNPALASGGDASVQEEA